MSDGSGFYAINDAEPAILEGIEGWEGELCGRFDPPPSDWELWLDQLRAAARRAEARGE